MTLPAPQAGDATISRHGRLAWPDVVKGACITLVVAWHVSSKALVHLPGAAGQAATAAWSTAAVLLTPLRMPLFFAVSGYFAARALRRPWRSVARDRVVRPYYLYALWLVVHSAVFAVAPLATESADSLVEFVGLLLLGVSNLWYLYALALYFVLARAGSRQPVAALMAAALASAAALTFEPPSWGNSTSLVQNAVFFLLGAYLPDLVDAAARQARPSTAAAGGLGFAVASIAVHATDTERVPFVGLGLAVLGIWSGITIAAVASRWRATAPLRQLGRVTLPVYVMHMPILAVMVAALNVSNVRPSAWQLAIGPAVATGVLIGACLVGHRLLHRIGASFFFALPVLGRGTGWRAATPHRGPRRALPDGSRAVSAHAPKTRRRPERKRLNPSSGS